MSEKLLTLREAASFLGIPEKEMRHLVKKGDIPAYQIGGLYLRFKEEQILSLKSRFLKQGSIASHEEKEHGFATENFLVSKIKDFFYFNDFYIISALFIAGLLYIILKSIK